MNDTKTEEQPKENISPVPSAEVPTPPKQAFEPGHADKKAYVDTGWSWGACMFNLVFAIATRNYIYLLLGLLFLIPFINIFALLGIMVFFGIKGRELARTSPMFGNHDEYLGFMKALDHAGKIVAIAYAVLLGVFLLFMMLAVSLGLRTWSGEGYYRSDDWAPMQDGIRIDYDSRMMRY